jgi:hypothetical protein
VNKILFAAALATLEVPVAFAGMYDHPYAIVESGDASEVRNEARLAISKVDGKSTRNPRKSDPLAPGKHNITLHFESARGLFRPTSRDVEIDLEPCTRYRIVANYEAKTGGGLEAQGLFRIDWRMRQEIQEVRCSAT